MCRCGSTRHKRSHLQTLIHSLFWQPLHVFGSSRPQTGLLPFTSQPILFLGLCPFASAVPASAQPRPQLPTEVPPPDASPCRRLGAERSAPLHIPACCRACSLLPQPGLSQNCCFPNSSFPVHNSACNCSCPKVIAVFLADYSPDYPLCSLSNPSLSPFILRSLLSFALRLSRTHRGALPHWSPCHHQHVTQQGG